MINRSQPPVTTTQQHLTLPPFDLQPITPHLQLLAIKDKTKKDIQLNFIVDRPHLPHREAFAMTELLMPCLIGSTKNQTKESLHTALNTYATQLQPLVHCDMLGLLMTCAKPSHFLDALPLMIDLLTHPSFQEKEIEQAKRQQQQQLQMFSQIPAFVATKKIEELRYGQDHPYAYHLKNKDLPLITPQKLKRTFDATAWHPGIVLLIGDIQDNIIQAVKQQFQTIPSQKKPPHPFPAFNPQTPNKATITLEHSQQSTILLGMDAIPANHPDNYAFLILCELLGGSYIGSLLMQNIREKKGSTYGIYCKLMRAKHDNVIVIQASVKQGNVEETRDDIFEQMRLLQEQPITENKLTLLKKHYQGILLALMDNTTQLGSSLAIMYMREQNFHRYQELYAKIQSITPEELQSTAQKYLHPQHFAQVIVNP